MPLLISNGTFLEKPELKAQILKAGRKILIQVGNDPRFYPRPVPVITDDERVSYKPLIEQLMPLGRATHGNAAKVDIPKQKAPASFNLRSMTRHFGSIEQAMVIHRGRAMQGKNGACSPNICQDGSIRAGETQPGHDTFLFTFFISKAFNIAPVLFVLAIKASKFLMLHFMFPLFNLNSG